MRVDLAVLADYAATTQEGKMIIAGIFDRIAAPKLPWMHPSMTLVVRIKLDPGEEGTHELDVRCVDPDGKEFLPSLHGTLSRENVDLLDGATMNVMLGIGGAQLPKPGHYHFDIDIDGRYEETVVFTVTEAPNPQAT